MGGSGGSGGWVGGKGHDCQGRPCTEVRPIPSIQKEFNEEKLLWFSYIMKVGEVMLYKGDG